MSPASHIDARLFGLARDLNRLALNLGLQAMEAPRVEATPLAIDLRALSLNMTRLADTIDLLAAAPPEPAQPPRAIASAPAGPDTPITIDGWFTGA